MDVPIIGGEQHWVCPNCPAEHVGAAPNRFHQCAGLKGLVAPLVVEGVDCQVRAVEREDYVGTDKVQLDGDGRPIMAVVTERADGSNDVAVLAPTASAKIRTLIQ